MYICVDLYIYILFLLFFRPGCGTTRSGRSCVSDWIFFCIQQYLVLLNSQGISYLFKSSSLSESVEFPCPKWRSVIETKCYGHVEKSC